VTDAHPPAARGTLLGILTVVAERGVAFVVVLSLARLLSPDEFGRYGYILAGMALVQVLADQGFEVAAVASMANAPARAGQVLRALLTWRLILWVGVMLPVGALVLPRLAGEAAGGSLVASGAAASVCGLLGSSISARSVRRARGAMGAMARVAIADAALGGTAIVGVAALGGGLTAIFLARAAASALVTVVALAASPVLSGSRGGASAAPPLGEVAAPLAANALLIAVQTRAGHLAAMALMGAEPVALLAAAARATEVLGILPEGALLALFPRMAASPETAIRLAADAARRLAVVVLALVCALVVGASRVAALLFGPAYAAAAPAIVVLAWGALFSVTGAVALHAIAALGRQRALVWANVVAAACGIVLQIVLVPRLGLRGAALATVATAACGQTVLAILPLTRAIVVAVWRSVAVAASLAVILASALASVRPDLVGATLATLAFVALVHLLGIVGRADWRALASAVRGA